MKRFVFGLVAACVLCVFETPALQADDTQKAALQKINLAGRQRMLSQRMSAAACVAMTGLADGAQAAIAQSAHDEFQKALEGLLNGDATSNLPAETSGEVRAALEVVQITWADISPSVQQLAAGYANVSAITQVMRTNTDLLRQSQEVVERIVANYGASSGATGVAKAIDIAGRQRMLSQRMVKAACFVFVGIGEADPASELSAAIELFDTSLRDLIRGNPSQGIAGPTSHAVKQQLDRVAELWLPFRQQLENMASGSKSGPQDLLAIAEAGDLMLDATNDAVSRYVD